MTQKLPVRLLWGPLIIGLACLIGVWLFARPAMEASLQDARHAELDAWLIHMLRHLEAPPALPAGTPDPEATRAKWTRWLEQQVSPPYRLTLLLPDGEIVADTRPGTAGTRLFERAFQPEPTISHWAGTHRHVDGELEQFVSRRISLPGQTALLRLAEPDTTIDESARLAFWMSGLIVAVTLCGLGLAWLDGRRLAVTLLALRDMLRKMRRHDFRPRVAVEGEYEVAVLQLEANKLARLLRTELADLDGARRRLWGVLDGMSEGVLVTDAAGVIILANRALGGILRLQGPAVGRTLLEVYRSPELANAIEKTLQSGAPDTLELNLRFPEPRTVVARLSRWGDQNRPAGVVAVLHDVTDMRKLEQVRRDFVANASHELRTPVAAIRGYAEALLDGDPLPDESRSFVEVIERNARRLGALVDDILSLARIESPSFRPVMEPVPLREAVDTVTRGLASLAAERRITVTTRPSPGLPAAWADRKAIEHVLTNLIDNALKYTPPGGSVEIRLESDPAHVTIEVADTGVGIPPDDLNRVFERFYRVDSARSRAVGGTGLGLAIVKHLVLAMGGEVSVRSTYGAGSTFRIVLDRVIDGGIGTVT